MEHKHLFKLFCRYASQSVLGMIGLSCYILADTFFVARGLGADGLTALNLAIPIYSFVNGAGLMAGMGGAARYSISGSKTVFTQGLYYVLMLSALFLAAGLLLPNQLAVLLGSAGVTHRMTAVYLRVILCFAPMFMLNNYFICFIRNDGNPRLAMTAMLVGSFSNIVLDYLFIFPLGMGMFGAAFATGIAPVVSLVILSSHITTRRNSFTLCRVRLRLGELWDISLLGVSALVTELSSGIVIIVFNGIILGLAGNLGVAAYGVIANIALVVTAMFTGISQGIQPIISRSYGAGDMGDVKRLIKYGIVTTIAFAAAAYAAAFVFAEPIVAVFNKDGNAQLAAIAANGLRIYFAAFAFVGINILCATCFSAIDKPKAAFIISLLRGFIVVIPAAFILSALLGINGVWLTPLFTELIVLVFSVYKLAAASKALRKKPLTYPFTHDIMSSTNENILIVIKTDEE